MNQGQQSAYPMASLYVGDLDLDVTEAMLYDKFSPVGPLLSLRVCRDMITRRSLGYAYINYHNPADAERALDTMNFDFLKGKPIRIMWSQRDPSLRKSGIGNVFIKNLDKAIDNKALFDTFSAFGHILSCKVTIDERGTSKGYGFVHFETEQSANEAIDKVNGMLLKDKKVYVGKFIPRVEREKQLGGKSKVFTNVYVKNFKENVSDRDLMQWFSEFGNITSCAVSRNPDGTSRCFGFVAFDDSGSAEAAVQKLHNVQINGQVLYVARAQKKSERANLLKRQYEKLRNERYTRCQGVNLFVKNLDDSVDDDRLRREFSSFGTITSAKVMTEEGRSKGFGFVCYSTSDEATKAVTEMNGKLVVSKPLYVALAQPKEGRKAYLASQYMQRYRLPHNLPFSPPNAPYLVHSIAHGPRFFNHIGHIRPVPRWPAAAPPVRPNGTYGAVANGPYRVSSRSSVQNLRNAVSARSITVQPPIVHSRPNSKYTANNPNSIDHTTTITLNNGGDSIPSQADSNAYASSGTQQDQKQMLGERLFAYVGKIYPEFAGKITGMLLEIDNTELLRMIDNKDSLKAKIEEAIAVLQAHQTKKSAMVRD